MECFNIMVLEKSVLKKHMKQMQTGNLGQVIFFHVVFDLDKLAL